MAQLPTFEDVRAEAFKRLDDTEDWLRSDWRPGTGPTREQGAALQDARATIRNAKEALDRAAR